MLTIDHRPRPLAAPQENRLHPRAAVRDIDLDSRGGGGAPAGRDRRPSGAPHPSGGTPITHAVVAVVYAHPITPSSTAA